MSGPNIITLTLNPVLDIATEVAEVVPLHKLRCAAEKRSPGGGGINIARALRRLGRSGTAVFTSGGPTGARVRDLLANEGIAALDVPIAGETREDFSVTEMRSGKQFRFVLPGPVVSEAEVSASLDAALALVKPDDFLVASGSLPPGAPHDTYQKVAHRSGAAGARFVLDCPADLLRGSLGPGLELIKPSFSEFVGLTGVSPREVEAARQAIDHLIATDRIRSIALTLGDEGAWYIGRNFAYSAKAPHVEPRSTVGAGDSFLAGLVLSLAESRSPEQSVRFAVACGAAALLAPGVELCRPDDVEKLLAAVVVELLP